MAKRSYPLAVIALDIGGTKIAGAAVVYDGAGRMPRVLMGRSIPTQPLRGGRAVLDDCAALAASLADEVRAAGFNLKGVGIASAGCIDPEDGSVASANDIMPGWAGMPLAQAVGEAAGLPAVALGDVQAHGLGEARWGSAEGASSALVVAVGTGLGGAIIIDGDVVRGFHGAAGHLGNTLHHRAAGLRCFCGHDHHTEMVVCGTAIAARYQKRSPFEELDGSLMGAQIARRAAEGEEFARRVVTDAGLALGEAIGSWCSLLDPQVVVLSGSVTRSGPLWWDAVAEGFASQAMGIMADTPIVEAALGDDAPLIGAAEYLLEQLS